MLTVCIPVFNDDVRKLVRDLLSQLEKEDIGAEILLIDDGSGESCKAQYAELKNARTTIVQLDKNIGRARIRNLFPRYARNEHLLFLDSDSVIIDPSFLRNYFEYIHHDAVICGGRIYPPAAGGKEYLLHWKYGNLRESKPAAARKREPSRSFMTHNFMIRKEVFRVTQFNEKLSAYGHEDTLFGFELMSAGVHIEHIDNPVLHGRLCTNREFLEKTKSGIQNLVFIVRELHGDPAFIRQVSLLKTYFNYRAFINIVAPLFTRITHRMLQKGSTNLHVFNLYKLFLFAEIFNRRDAR